METTTTELQVGDILTRVGRTSHAAIVVTEARVNLAGGITVYGYNQRDKTPRCMFRNLLPGLPVFVL